ncbi:MAG: hypothetical protein GXP27_16110 [Planctomycetes bacterium]|nr:hypothetical protein [Planctomycetota bacterium]
MIEFLLASNGRAALDYMRRSASLRENWPLLVAFALIAFFWILLYLWDQFQRRRRSRPQKAESLLQELCKAHKLSYFEQQLLAEAAAQQGLKHPGQLFVDRRLLAELAKPPNPHAARLTKLSEKLLGPGEPT